MTSEQAEHEFDAGIQNIQQEIINKLREAGLDASVDSFRWHRNKDLSLCPESLGFEVHVNNKKAEAILARTYLEDSCQKVDRPEVIAIIKSVVSALL
jgi:hypothetical protein